MEGEPTADRPQPIARRLPWTRLLEGIGLGLDSRSLILAVLGVFALRMGWSAIDLLDGTSGLGASWPQPGKLPEMPGPIPAIGDGAGPAEPFLILSMPFRNLFTVGIDGKHLLINLLAALWTVIVWGIIGGAISRISAVRIARGERVGVGTALRFAIRRWVALVGAPLCPLIGVGFLTFLCALVGLLYRLPDWLGDAIGGCLAFLPLLAGLVMAMILFGLAAGWPLMTATVAVEGEDVFDSISRSYSYVYQRPGRVLGYVAIAWGVGLVGTWIVDFFASWVVRLSVWGLAFGGPSDRLAALFGLDPIRGATAQDKPHWFWVAVVRGFAQGWRYSYFWAASTMIYLLLRLEVDGAPIQDVAADHEPDEPFAPTEARSAIVELPGQ